MFFGSISFFDEIRKRESNYAEVDLNPIQISLTIVQARDIIIFFEKIM